MAHPNFDNFVSATKPDSQPEPSADENVLAVERVKTQAETTTDPSKKFADMSPFKIPNNILKAIGELARETYERGESDVLGDLNRDEWTYFEEVITGFENR